MPDTGDTHRDASRQVATDRDFTLSIEDVAERYASAGHPRTLRTLQRYCASGHLECQKIPTTLGDKYYVAPFSVARHIAQINEVIAFTERTTGRDLSRPTATPVAPVLSQPQGTHERATEPDLSRPVATSRVDEPSAEQGRAAARALEKLEDENTFLRDQIRTKDKQIDALLERDRETNILVRGLQEMLTPLLGPWRDQGRRDDREQAS